MKKHPLVSITLFALLISACAPNPTPLPVVTLTPDQPGTGDANGVIEYPYLHADAGNFQLETGATITFTWKGAPPGADRYDFVVEPTDGSLPILLGIDTDASDGVSIPWQVFPSISGELKGLAYYPDGRILESGLSGTIHSGP
jgi:hypothetical protein